MGVGVGGGEAGVGVGVVATVGVVDGTGVGELPFRVDTAVWLTWGALGGLAAWAMPQIVTGATTVYKASTAAKATAG